MSTAASVDRRPSFDVSARAERYYEAQEAAVHRRTDRAFAWLTLAQWALCVVFAAVLTPVTWIGAVAATHVHVLVALGLGGLLAAPAAALGFLAPGRVVTRHVVAASQAGFSALIIHLLGGRIEAHFHVFGSLAFLAFYRDVRVLYLAAGLVVIDHAARGLYWPESIYGFADASRLRWLEHGAWVAFECVVLTFGLRQSRREMQELAERRATDEQRARELGMLSLLAERTTNSVIFTGGDGLVEWVNPGFTRLTGFTLDEVRGLKPGAFLQGPESDPEAIDRIRQAIRRREPVQVELVNYSKSRHPYWVLLDIQPIVLPGGREGFVAVETDVSEGKRTQRRLLEAKIAAEQADRAKSEFLANMSHEIRTPLNGVIGTTSLLLDTTLDEQQEELARLSLTSAESLLSLVNDVLDLSKIDAGRLQIERSPFDLADLVETTISMLAPRGREKDVELVCGVDPRLHPAVFGDPTRVRQVLMNLVGNAIKFTEQGSVAVEARLVDTTDDAITVSITVTDTGIGIPPDRLESIFESFTQADASTTRRFGGTGLGLSITRELVALMDGRIEVESTVGEGTRFTATLRFERDPDYDPGEAPRQLRGRRILVVDDNPINRRIFRQYLETWEMDVTLARDAEEAEQILRCRPEDEAFDLILLDYQMPGRCGVELVADLDVAGLLECPVVLATSCDALDLTQSDRSRFAHVVLKPIQRLRLATTLAEAVSGEAVDRGRRRRDPAKDAVVDLAGRRVLVAEDNRTNQVVVRRFLERLGAEPVVAENGAEAVKAFESGAFDAILMDCQMPELDGFEATRRIRVLEAQRSDDDARTPIIALTANAVAGDRQRCLDAGMDDYLGKPVRPEQLAATLGRWIDGAVLAAPASDGARDEAAPATGTSAFDLEGLLARTSDDRALAAEILRCFAEDLPDVRASVEAAGAESIERLQRAAHAAKGAALNCSAEPMAEAAIALEAAARDASDLEELADAVAALVREVDRCRAAADEAAGRLEAEGRA